MAMARSAVPGARADAARLPTRDRRVPGGLPPPARRSHPLHPPPPGRTPPPPHRPARRARRHTDREPRGARARVAADPRRTARETPQRRGPRRAHRRPDVREMLLADVEVLELLVLAKAVHAHLPADAALLVSTE